MITGKRVDNSGVKLNIIVSLTKQLKHYNNLSIEVT